LLPSDQCGFLDHVTPPGSGKHRTLAGGTQDPGQGTFVNTRARGFAGEAASVVLSGGA
jgi:hypothetical protein